MDLVYVLINFMSIPPSANVKQRPINLAAKYHEATYTKIDQLQKVIFINVVQYADWITNSVVILKNN